MSSPHDDGLPPLREVIRDLDLTAKKTLGQNFILDLNLTRRIARSVGALDGATVVEVGPGPGGLTRGLLMEGAAHVIAVEKDRRCIPALHAIAAHYPGRLTVIEGDALAVDWPSVLPPDGGKARIIANLPYSVATPLLTGWLKTDPWPPWWDRMALMFQLEVAERIVAPPGSKTYGRLGVLAQWRAETRIALRLPPAAFTPPPKVASAVVEFRPRATPLDVGGAEALERLTAAAFGQRRKMLRAGLKGFPGALAALETLGIDPTQRAEQLTVAQFCAIAAATASAY